MRVLLASGADRALAAFDGTTILMTAAESISAGAIQDGRKRRGAEDRQIEAVKLALEVGITVNAINHAKETALHGAAASRYASVINLLIQSGAAVNPKDGNNQTPLDVVLSCLYCVSGGAMDIGGARRAAARGREEAAAVLRKNGGTSDNVVGL